MTAYMSSGSDGLSGMQSLIAGVFHFLDRHGEIVRRILGIVGRQVGKQLLDQRDRVPVVLGNEVGVAADRRMHLGAADFRHRRRAAGHRLDHLRAGEEHVRVVAGHDHEVHQRRRVGGTARARTADHRDLRHHPGEQDVGVEHVAVAGERIDAFLNARAA
jgi:hypothetical protein